MENHLPHNHPQQNQQRQPWLRRRQRQSRRRQPPHFAPYPFFYPHPPPPHPTWAPPIHPPYQFNYFNRCIIYPSSSVNPVNPPSAPQQEHDHRRGRKRKEEKKQIPFDPNNPKNCVMIKTVPCGINREEFVNYVKQHCCQENQKAKDEGRPETSLVDVIYLPFDFRKKVNKGYAFVNFTEPAGALNFYDKFHNKISLPNSTRKMEIACALMQGGKESILKYLNERVTSWPEDYGPISFDPPLGGLEMEKKALKSGQIPDALDRGVTNSSMGNENVKDDNLAKDGEDGANDGANDGSRDGNSEQTNEPPAEMEALKSGQIRNDLDRGVTNSTTGNENVKDDNMATDGEDAANDGSRDANSEQKRCTC